MNWRYFNPVDVHFGPEELRNASQNFADLSKTLLVTSRGMRERGVIESLELLINSRFDLIFDRVSPNPNVQQIVEAGEELSELNISNIVALGGGSTIDFAKALSILLHPEYDGSIEAQLENGICKGQSIRVTAIPTTSGTGSEVTPFCTIWHQDLERKYSLDSEMLFPKTAYLVPSLTIPLAKTETINTSLDALSHCVETLWNQKSTPLTRNLARLGIYKIVGNLHLAISEPHNLLARTELQEAALFGGLAISQNRTAIAHSMSYPLTAHFGVPHGIACSYSIPQLFKYLRNIVSLDMDSNLALSAASELVESLDLVNTLLSYVKVDDVFSVSNEMINPSRAGNFLVPIDQATIFTILHDIFE